MKAKCLNQANFVYFNRFFERFRIWVTFELYVHKTKWTAHLLSMWMKVFAALQSLWRRRSHKSSRFLEQCQRNTKCWGIRQFTQSSILQQKYTHAHTRGWETEREKVEKKRWNQYFSLSFSSESFILISILHRIDPIFKYKSRLTLFARTWRWLRWRQQQQQNEIALVENGKVYRKKTLWKCTEMYSFFRLV